MSKLIQQKKAVTATNISRKKVSVRHIEVASFKKLKESYQLGTPEQIKLKIIFNNLMQLVIQEFGNTPGNSDIVERYKRQWRICEQEELRIANKSN